jgi:hypothetical protein
VRTRPTPAAPSPAPLPIDPSLTRDPGAPDLEAPDPSSRVARAADRASARRVFIEETAAALGRKWAIGCRSELHQEGRAAAGGWPGTLHEARLLIGRSLPTEVSGRNMATITEAEREIAVRAAYASARSEWLRNAETEPP